MGKFRGFTGDDRDAPPRVLLHEQIHCVLERFRLEQQRRDVLEHDPCNPISISWRTREKTSAWLIQTSMETAKRIKFVRENKKNWHQNPTF